MKSRLLALCTVLAASLASAQTPTLQTSGRNIVDRCGNVFVAKGLEQVIRSDTMMNNSWVPIMDQIAATGANSLRIVNENGSVSDLNAVIGRAVSFNMVVYVTVGTSSFGDPAMKAMLENYKSHIVIDIGEPAYNDPTRWRNDSIAAVNFIRGHGYQAPMCIMTDHYGRNLPAAIQHGAAIVAADPLHRVIIGWQAYWGNSNWYQNSYGMTYTQAMAAVVAQNFPIQVGITADADIPADPINYQSVMTLAHQNNLSTMWWDYYNRAPWLPQPEGDPNDLSIDGTTTNLTPLGNIVLRTHAASFQNAPRAKVCTGVSNLPSVSVTMTDTQAGEAGTNTGVFRLTRTGATTSALTVAFTMSQNASFNTDYLLYVGPTQLTTSQVTIPAGASSVDIRLTPLPDSLGERCEWAQLNVSTNANHTAGVPASGVIAIEDNYVNAGICKANLDNSINNSLTANDFSTYLDSFVANATRADMNADGRLNAIDFVAFIDAYAAGCP